MTQVLARDPFPDAPPNRTLAIFLDGPPPSDTLERNSGVDGKEVQLGRREIYVPYGDNRGRSKPRILAVIDGTARNIDTVAKLAAMAAEF